MQSLFGLATIYSTACNDRSEVYVLVPRGQQCPRLWFFIVTRWQCYHTVIWNDTEL